MRLRRDYLTWVLALACVGASAIAATGQTVERRIERVRDAIPPPVAVEGESGETTTLQKLMADLHVPGVSVAVIHNGKIDWARGFGVTHLGGPNVTPDTPFQAASISKPITAFAVMQLVQSGRLKLDTNVNEYLKNWKILDNEFTAQSNVTLRELLSHTAGINVEGFGGYDAGEPLPTLLQMLNGQPPANNAPIRVDTVPGTKQRYAGGGYVILRQMLEDITGQPFPQLMRDRVLSPIGMSHSAFEQPLTSPHLTEAAMPANNDGRTLRHGPRIYPELAPDGLWTTASDLARYAIEVQRSLAGRPGSLLTPATAHLMLTPVLNHFALGLIIGDDDRHPYFMHTGGNIGYIGNLVVFNRGEGAVVLTNGTQGYAISIDLIRSIAQEYDWPDLKPVKRRTVAIDPKTLQGFVGAYQSSPDIFYVVTHAGSRLFIHTSGGARESMLPMAQHRFFLRGDHHWSFDPRDDEVEVSFETDPSGQATELTLSENGTTPAGTAKRLSEDAANPLIKQMAELEKRYAAQAPPPGEEAGLRRMVSEMAAGKPDYGSMTSKVANQVRPITALNQQIFSALGAVVSTSFKEMSASGIDTYHVVFEHGDGDFEISLDNHGKIRHALYYQE
jgi:CubicO group peptidase (beta-lactamase class C family)